MLDSELQDLKIANRLFFKIWDIEQRDIFSETEISNLLKELELVDHIPHIRNYLDLHYKVVNSRETIVMSVSRFRSAFHKILKQYNRDPMEKDHITLKQGNRRYV